MDRAELRAWLGDALERHDRDVHERGESATDVTVVEIVDAIWGRLPLEVRRASSRAQVQAGLTMLTLRHGIAEHAAGSPAAPPPTRPALAPRHRQP